MGIEDLPNWADNIELVRLPRIETDIAQSQAVIGNLSSELSARVQEFVDTLIAHNARLNTGQATASTARDLANDALQRLFGNEFAARIYTDNRIQDLRDQVNADLVGVTGQLLPGSPLIEYLDERAGAQAGAVRTDFGPILLGLQSELESIQARVTDAEALSNELINTVIPAVDVDLAAGALLRDQVQNELNRVMAGFNYETLIEGMDDVREQVWSALDPIGKHVLVSPRADWTLTAHTSAYANPKAPLPEGNLAPAAHARGEHGMFGAGTANQTIGQAVPVNFIPGRFYLLRATVWTESTTTAVSVSLGATTFAGTTAADVGVKRLAATGLLAADGTVELSCIFSSDGEQLEELGYKIGTGTEDEALVLSGSVGADKAFFFVEQNTGGATTGRLRLSKLAVIDITSAIDVVRISRERVQSQFREAEASIETLQATMVTLDSAMAGLGTTLNSRIGNVESNLANNYLTSVQTGTAIAAAETALNTRVGNVEANLLNNYFTKAETESSMSGYVTQAAAQASLSTAAKDIILNLSNTSPILPATFENGLINWTTARGGSPTGPHVVSRLAAVSNDSEFGACAEWTPNTIGANILTRGVVPSPGKIYRLKVVFRLDSIAGGDTVLLSAVMAMNGMLYDNPTAGFTPNVVYGLGTHTYSRIIGQEAGAGIETVFSQLANYPWVRFGFRLGENKQITMRIKSIEVVDATSEVLSQRAAAASVTSAGLAEASATAAGQSASASQSDRLLAQTARAGAESALGTTITAKEDAQGAASTATTQAGIATSARDAASGHANAASQSAGTATTQASAAAASAAVATNQANTATTQAGLAATSATQSASSASDAAGSANVASTNASTSAQALGSLQLAMANIPNLIPAPVVESNGFGGNAAGSVIAYSTFAPSFYMTGPDGPFIRRSIAAAIPAVFARALAPMTGDDTKTFRVSIRFTPSVNMDVSLRMAFIRSNGLVSGSIINGPTVAALAGQTITLTAVVGRNAVGMVTLPIGTATNWSESIGIRMGMRSITLDPVAHYDVHEIQVEDLTQAQIATLRSGEADSSANAAATSATNAAASANASAQSATASQTERVAAQTARSGSEIARDDAVGARTVAQGAAGDALNSANAAAGSATTAASSLSLISKVHAGSLIPNGNFNTGDLTLWEGNAIGTTAAVLPRGASGSLVYTNAPSPFFLTLAYDTVDRSIEVSQISVEAGELFAWSLRAARSVSGSTAVRVSMVWYGANGLVISASDVPITLNDLVWVVQSGTFTAPALAKTAKLMITKIGGNNPGTPRACFGDIRLTRADPATMALATQTFRTVAQVDSAIATALSTLQATVPGGLTATVTSQQTAIANLSGYAAATAALTATLSDGKIAGIRATVHNGAGGQTNSSVLELLGDQVIAEGTISTNKLNVGLGLNQVVDSEFSAGVSNWQKVGSGPVNDQTFLGVRAPGGTWAGKSYPTLVLNQTGNATGSDVIIANVARLQDGTQQARIMAVSPGDWIEASIKASTHRCVGTLNIQFLTEAGVEINAPSVDTFAGNVVSSANNPDAWPLYGGKVQAPEDSAYARILVTKGPTTSGQANSLLFIHRPMLAKTTALATELTPYSPPGQTYINGGAMITGSITADKLQVNSLDAISATIGILRTATSGARMEIHSDKILVYDASNMVRVRLGNLV